MFQTYNFFGEVPVELSRALMGQAESNVWGCSDVLYGFFGKGACRAGKIKTYSDKKIPATWAGICLDRLNPAQQFFFLFSEFCLCQNPLVSQFSQFLYCVNCALGLVILRPRCFGSFDCLRNYP